MATKSLFLEDYIFRGSQNEKAIALTSLIDKESNTPIFSSLVELFICASIVGCYFNRRSKPEKGDVGKKIFATQFTTHSQQLNLAFRLVLLVGGKEQADSIERLNRTFRNPETQDNYELFESFMLGGIDELYDTFILDSNNRYEDYLTSLSKFLNEFAEKQESDEDGPSTEDIF